MRQPPETKEPAAFGAAGSLGISKSGPTSSETISEKRPTRQARWQAANPVARWSHLATASALRLGLIHKGPCQVCGTTENVDLHHPDWTRPLETVPLCRKHHRQLHAEERRRKVGAA